MKISIIAGARPNFIKIAPIIHEINRVHENGADISFRLIHTGQHYDRNMSGSFFTELNIPEPDINLECSNGSQSELTSSIMLSFEKELIKNPADLVLVVGDVTSTMSCAIVAQKLKTKVAHVEGGIRSNDWNMPEEINRLVTDSISNYFFTTSATANKNLFNSGIDKRKIFFVGNTMIDTLLAFKNKFKKPKFWHTFKLSKKKYIVLTLHRPANVDEQNILKLFLNEIILNTREFDIIFPMHPRTKKIFDSLDFSSSRLYTTPPLSYLEFNYLVERSFAVITDSGGITEETTVMGIPCITLRDNTERPETITIGTNELIGVNPSAIAPTLNKLFNGSWKIGGIPELWDGKASKRIVKTLINLK